MRTQNHISEGVGRRPRRLLGKGRAQLLHHLGHSFSNFDPFPFLPSLQLKELVGQIQGGENRDPRRILRPHLLGDLAHFSIDEIRERLDVATPVAAADVVRGTEDPHLGGVDSRAQRQVPRAVYGPASGLNP